MSEITHVIQFFTFVVLVGASGAAFTLGVALVCRALNWAPVSITVNIIKDD